MHAPGVVMTRVRELAMHARSEMSPIRPPNSGAMYTGLPEMRWICSTRAPAYAAAGMRASTALMAKAVGEAARGACQWEGPVRD